MTCNICKEEDGHSPLCPNVTEADLRRFAELEELVPNGIFAAGALADAGSERSDDFIVVRELDKPIDIDRINARLKERGYKTIQSKKEGDRDE